MRIYNSDGGEVESCGNAARCVAHLLMDEKGAREIKLETTGGALVCKADGANVSVDMGVPKFGWREIPMAHEVSTENFSLHLPGTELDAIAATAVNVGNPHVVLFVDDAETAPVSEAGPNIEIHPLFPQRTNVEFVSLIGKDRLRMRVWERGVGITLACGTGACATMVAAHRRGLVGHKAEVVLDGGSLILEWGGEGTPVIMTGPWAQTYKGDVDLAALAR
jgi:diaminopimelate epimerase